MDSTTTSKPIDLGTVERLRALHRAEAEAMQAMHATLGQHGADPKYLDKWIAASGALNEAVRQALPALLDALDRTPSDMAVRADWRDIATAPKDGTRVLLWMTGPYQSETMIGSWNDERYATKPRPYWTTDDERYLGKRYRRANQPAVWQPLPVAPASETTA